MRKTKRQYYEWLSYFAINYAGKNAHAHALSRSRRHRPVTCWIRALLALLQAPRCVCSNALLLCTICGVFVCVIFFLWLSVTVYFCCCCCYFCHNLRIVQMYLLSSCCLWFNYNLYTFPFFTYLGTFVLFYFL